MTPRRAPLVGLTGLLLIGLAVATLASRRDQGPVYSVATVQARLARSPEVWVGRTVRVRGVALPPGCVERESMLCVPASSYAAYIVDPAAVALLPLTWGAADPLRSILRYLLLAAGLAPSAQALNWGKLATYRVQLRAAPAGSCASPPCYEALLDAAP